MLTVITFFFVLSFLILVHELGHYTVAKLAGIGVHRFSIGIPPRLFGMQIGETDYCISAIPFGGYVKLFGQEDFGEEEVYDNHPKDYRGKTTPVKIAVLVAGSLMNIVTAVVILTFLFFTNGIPVNTTIIGSVEEGSLASKMGFKAGDEIEAVQGKKIEQLDDILLPLFMNDNVTITVKHLDQVRTLTVPRKLKENESFGILQYYEARVGSVIKGGAAEKAGFIPDDIITEIDGEQIVGWDNMSSIVRANPDREMTFTLQRGDTTVKLPVSIGSDVMDMPDGTRKVVGVIGISLHIPVRKVGFIESSRLAVKNTVYLVTHMLDFIGKLVTGQVSTKMLGGPIMIAQMAGESAKVGFASLMGLTAFISINLGVLNLLPVPVLDGGHIFILLIEAVIRKKMSARVKLALQQMGSLLLLLLMLYITFNDIMRFETIAKLFGGG